MMVEAGMKMVEQFLINNSLQESPEGKIND